jgi:hypothetical protein
VRCGCLTHRFGLTHPPPHLPVVDSFDRYLRHGALSMNPAESRARGVSYNAARTYNTQLLPSSSQVRRTQRGAAESQGIYVRPFTPPAHISKMGTRPQTASGLRSGAALAAAQVDARRRLRAAKMDGRMDAAKALSQLSLSRPSTVDDMKPTPMAVRLAFAAFDHNRSGYLNYRELRSALRAYGVDVSARDAARVLHAYDERPDGKMDLSEFEQLVVDLQSGLIRAAAAPAYNPS